MSKKRLQPAGGFQERKETYQITEALCTLFKENNNQKTQPFFLGFFHRAGSSANLLPELYLEPFLTAKAPVSLFQTDA